MKLRSTVNPVIYNTKSIQDDLLPYFSWTKGWKIQVSSGLQIPLGNLLADIQDILGGEPNIIFLRIVEEQVDDELFVRKLRVFIESNDANTAKKAAIEYAINKVEIASEDQCYRCGNLLHHDTEIDKEHLTYYASVHNIEKYSMQFMKICPHCVRRTCEGYESGISDDNSPSIENQEADEIALQSETQLPEINTDTVIEEQQEKDSEKTTQEDPNDKKGKLECGQKITLYDRSSLKKLEESYQGASREQVSRIKNLTKRLKESSAEKLLVSIPDNWQKQCDALQHNFPNFNEVTTFVRHQFALSSVSDQKLRFSPFLLVGDTGIGKTEYMLTLADLCHTKLEVIDISSAQSGATLTGSESFWGNTQTGVIFNSLMFSDTANPIFMLDEIDKASGNASYQPLSALHSLLEARQAKQFKDLSVPEILIDASNIVWIATANSVESIEKPILDRFLVFYVETPTAKQMRNIVKNQYQRYLEQSAAGQFFEAEIRSDVIDELCKYHPRSVKKRLSLAFGFAANEQRNQLIVSDIQNNILSEERKKIGMGFMSANI